MEILPADSHWEILAVMQARQHVASGQGYNPLQPTDNRFNRGPETVYLHGYAHYLRIYRATWKELGGGTLGPVPRLADYGLKAA